MATIDRRRSGDENSAAGSLQGLGKLPSCPSHLNCSVTGCPPLWWGRCIVIFTPSCALLKEGHETLRAASILFWRHVESGVVAGCIVGISALAGFFKSEAGVRCPLRT